MAVSFISGPGNTRLRQMRAERFPNEVRFYAALLDHPKNVEPTTHIHADEMLSWVHLSDNLPRKRSRKDLAVRNATTRIGVSGIPTSKLVPCWYLRALGPICILRQSSVCAN
jgi:hypothetical protein